MEQVLATTKMISDLGIDSPAIMMMRIKEALDEFGDEMMKVKERPEDIITPSDCKVVMTLQLIRKD